MNREDVTVWNTDGDTVIVLPGGSRPHDMPFDGALAFSPDGRKVVANRYDNNVNVWTTLLEPKRVVDRRVRLRTNERRQYSIGKAIDRYPDDPWYLVARGRANSSEGESRYALQDYLRAKRILTDEHCLFLDGDSFVQGPCLPFHKYGGFTIEAWVKRWSQSPLEYEVPIVSQFHGSDISDYRSRVARGRQITRGIRLPAQRHHDVSQWMHVAVCYDGASQKTFVDGQLTTEEAYDLQSIAVIDGKPIEDDLYIGGSVFGDDLAKGEGLIRTVRISTRPLYEQNFTPDRSFKTDAGCVLLYDFSQDTGEQSTKILDRSGNGNDGQLKEAWWIPQSE